MKKKVGILSMQRVINYGSYLQAYALKQLLLRHGAKSVEFIDIKEGLHTKEYTIKGLPHYLRRLRAFIVLLLNRRVIHKIKTRNFMKEVSSTIRNAWPDLGLSNIPSYPNVDLAVIGSDEVFHCCQQTWWGFTTQLYGDIPNASEIVSYAGSFGGTTLENLKKLGWDKQISDNLKKLKFISVRDDNSKHIVEMLTGIKSRLDIDPVLAYGFKNEINNVNPVDEKDYILLYSYPDRINDTNEIKAIRNFAKKRNKKLISIMSCYDWCDRGVVCTPLDVLAWFRNADMVITETFHGSIFSIITERQFATFGRKSAMPKLTSMLSPYGLESRLVKDFKIENVFADEIDYECVNSKLSELRKCSENYIAEILSDNN